MLKFLALFFSCLLLSGCGFTLRGTEGSLLNPAFQEIHLNYRNNSAELGQILHRRLAAAGITLIDSSNGYQLSIVDEQSLERVVSVNPNARAGEYELTLVVSFRFNNNAETIIPVQVISLQQVYEADPGNAAAKTNEAKLLLTELRQDVAGQILTRLQATQ